LAKQVRDLAAEDINRKRIQRSRDMHSLKTGRPLVWIDEIPWHEMNIGDALTLRTQSKEAQGMETRFRRILYRWKYIQADMVVEDTWYIGKAFSDSGNGFKVKEETISTNAANHIVSHHYEDQLDTEEKVEALKLPEIRAEPERDKQNLRAAQDVLDGIFPESSAETGSTMLPGTRSPRSGALKTASWI
jgi:hypothetical protein